MVLLQLPPDETRALHELLRHTPSAEELRRVQALLRLHQGRPALEVADLLGVRRQTVHNWVQRFQQRQGLDLHQRLRDAPRSGRPPTAQGVIDPLIEAVIDHDPRRYGYRATSWTAPLLRSYLQDVQGVATSQRSVSRILADLGIRWKRPRHELALRSPTWRQSKGGSSAASRGACAPCC
jgi:transposase